MKGDKLKKVSKHANQKMNGHDNLFNVVCRHKMVNNKLCHLTFIICNLMN